MGVPACKRFYSRNLEPQPIKTQSKYGCNAIERPFTGEFLPPDEHPFRGTGV